MDNHNNTLTSGYVQIMPTSAPCPSCGHCPSCGRGGRQASPWAIPMPYIAPYPHTPYWGTPYWGVNIGVSGPPGTTLC